jgi:hypothetical protein
MAINLEFISNLPMELQEDILRHLSNRMDKDFPIEINDEVYFVEQPVANLIDSLTKECDHYKSELDVRIQKN